MIKLTQTIIQLFCIILLVGCSLNVEGKDYNVKEIENIINSTYSEENVLLTHSIDNKDIILYEWNETIYFFYFLDKTLRNHNRKPLELVDEDGISWSAGSEIDGDSHVWGVVNESQEVPVGLENHEMEFLHLKFDTYTIFYIVTEENLNSPILFSY
ncbi:hypothetical protein FIU87_21095 [Bacillus sp. THAF10]|uniref:hypothetical protein n=1 Tax=Bacillus sp. THAF10 TaxID=2587848 RepID=UPI001267C92F|nr:hypothetical protein [Bacillus sp. THAF10]QFT91151.1 hypothetical protein FIU87_21095 [Bacillus sp. THAF10]